MNSYNTYIHTVYSQYKGKIRAWRCSQCLRTFLAPAEDLSTYFRWFTTIYNPSSRSSDTMFDLCEHRTRLHMQSLRHKPPSN